MVIDDLIYGKLLDSLYPKSFLMTDEDGLQHEVIHYGDVKNAIEDFRIELKRRVGVSKTENGDTISRQAAIDALDVLCQEHRYKIPGKAETYSQYNEAWQDALDRAEGAIGNLPSVQPHHNAEVSKMVDDCISRQAAIDALDCINGVEEVLRSLPSAQPVNADLIQKIEEGIKATSPTDEYMVGMRNGMKWCKSLLDGKEPVYDIVQPNYRKAFSVACELLIGANLFGTTEETMFAEIMDKEGIVSSLGYEKYILENLARLTGEDDGTD